MNFIHQRRKFNTLFYALFTVVFKMIAQVAFLVKCVVEIIVYYINEMSCIYFVCNEQWGGNSFNCVLNQIQ